MGEADAMSESELQARIASALSTYEHASDCTLWTFRDPRDGYCDCWRSAFENKVVWP